MRRLLADLFDDLKRLEMRIAELAREIEAVAGKGETASRLMTIPGVGALGATALLAAAGVRTRKPFIAGFMRGAATRFCAKF
jgi:transposase